MSQRPYGQPAEVAPVAGEASMRGPGALGVSLTPGAARETADRLHAAAGRADKGHVEQIDIDDESTVLRWASRLGVDAAKIRATVAVVGPDSEAVEQRLTSRPGADD